MKLLRLCWPTTSHTIAAGDADEWCQKLISILVESAETTEF